MFFKESFCGPYKSTLLIPNKEKVKAPRRQFRPVNLYDGQIPIKIAKLRDRQHLSQFLENPKAKTFYNNISSVEGGMIGNLEQEEDILMGDVE